MLSPPKSDMSTSLLACLLCACTNFSLNFAQTCIYAYTQQRSILIEMAKFRILIYQAVSRVTKHEVLKDPPLVDIESGRKENMYFKIKSNGEHKYKPGLVMYAMSTIVNMYREHVIT